MKLYTLISIALGVFGGTYSAFATLRVYLDPFFKDAIEEAGRQMAKIKAHFTDNNPDTICCSDYQAKIKGSRIVWNLCNAVPSVCFSVIVYFIAGWVLFNWDMICTETDSTPLDHTKFPWTWFYYCLIALILIDFGCVVIALGAAAFCLIFAKLLSAKHETVVQEEIRQVVPDPPAAQIQIPPPDQQH